MKFKKISAIISLILCLAMLTNSTAFAVKSQPDSAVESISIFPMYGVLEGQSRQMSATVDANGSFFDSVEWSSSNPNAISCTEDGIIKGLIAGESATITCKAKWGSVKDTIKVYCAEKIPSPVKCTPKNIITTIYAQPSTGIWSGTIFSFPQFFDIIALVFRLMLIPMNFSEALTVNSKLTVYGRIKDYAYVKYGESEIFDGFVKYTSLPISVDGFLELSAEDIDLWADDITYTSKKLTATYDGDVEWIYDNNYIDFDETTGQITGSKAGAGKKVTITAKADGMTKTCTIHLLYKWPLEWTGEVNQETYVYKANGNGYKKTSTTLLAGDKFTVKGDTGINSGWAFGITENKEWGYVPISHISTKNTISYYNGLNWDWPLENKNYNYVNSPHAPRPSLNDEHRGFDINEKEGQADIAGQVLVAPFDGVVKWVGADLNTSNGCGYYICITSNTVDPVTGKNLIAIYQHMQSKAKFSINETVKKGDVVGYAGNTGRSEGSHLHFEVNNWNARIGESGRSDFTYTINPIYFYMDMVKSDELILNMDCSAVKSGYSFYFYNYDK